MQKVERRIFVENGTPFVTELTETTEEWCLEELLTAAGIEPKNVQINALDDNYESVSAKHVSFDRRTLRDKDGNVVELVRKTKTIKVEVEQEENVGWEIKILEAAT